MDSALPKFILSQDYELFFHKSGSIEKCLFEPCTALLNFADRHDSKITFFVDAGMLRCMERHTRLEHSARRVLDRVRKHVTSLADAGHEIALHVHPHWEDTQWLDNDWQFAGTRYKIDMFSLEETDRIFRDYAACLAELSGCMPTAYRAGGFCVEPFDQIRAVLSDLGIFIDSSVLPGALLRDPEKGFDFRHVPNRESWTFQDSPTSHEVDGDFLEIPISAQRMPFFYYWERALDRVGASNISTHFGDGSSKRIGRAEIARRLLGLSRVAELSIDDAKAEHLLRFANLHSDRQLWQVMGHPKLLSRRSLQTLDQFMERVGLRRFDTITAVAGEIRADHGATV